MKPAEKTQLAGAAERGHDTSLGRLLREVSEPQFPVGLPAFAVADLPTAADYTNCAVVCTDGAAGSAILAWSDGTNWKRSDTGGTVAAA
ncbi:MAG: hypothetical protein RJQ08_13685 [Salinisphaeraceae bacterium]